MRQYTAQELLKLSSEEQESYIAWSFAQAENIDFEIFEADSDDETDDDTVYLCAIEKNIHQAKKHHQRTTENP